MLNQNPRQADFVLGSCPNCQKVVRIPVTAVTSQSKSQVKCPICSSAFEIAEILEETIPSVEVVDDTASEEETSSLPPEKINAIDTPELFHVSKENYQPKTEKKNGRFVVPELLSKGITKKRKKSRRRSRRSPEEKKLVEKSLAKLKENTQSASLGTPPESPDKEPQTERNSSRRERGSGSGRSRRSSKQKQVDKKRTNENVIDLNSLVSVKSSIANLVHRFASKIKDPGSKIEVIMIGIGALFAIPVLHLVMWWFVGIDPLGLARPTGYIVPFAVPQELRPQDDTVPKKSPLLIRPEQSQDLEKESSVLGSDGKLPRPKLDPGSVHAD